MLAPVHAILASYLLGSIPFGLVMARVLKGVDLREVGSGNIGATNAMRVLGKPLGLVAFLLDFGKGLVPTLVLAPHAAVLDDTTPWLAAAACGTAAVIGHCFPLYLRFKGGKGVATGCGAIVGVDPMIFILSGLVWVACLVTTRYVGLASIAMGLAFPVLPPCAWTTPPPSSSPARCSLCSSWSGTGRTSSGCSPGPSPASAARPRAPPPLTRNHDHD